jgi:hypothetical protein
MDRVTMSAAVPEPPRCAGAEFFWRVWRRAQQAASFATSIKRSLADRFHESSWFSDWAICLPGRGVADASSGWLQ